MEKDNFDWYEGNKWEAAENTAENEPAAPANNQELGRAAVESFQSPEDIFDDAKEGFTSVETPEQERKTAETSGNIAPERAEKLKKGIKVVVGGPPHSGKSVFLEGLRQNLGEGCFLFSAAPDGEGTWLQQAYDDAEVVKYRRKGKFTKEFVDQKTKQIKNWDGPIMLIDIGGIPSAENTQIIEGATHAIVLAGSDERKGQQAFVEIGKWEQYFSDNGLDVIAKLHSHYDAGAKDLHVEGLDDHVTGSVHYLERGEDVRERETIREVAAKIYELADHNEAYQDAHEAGYQPNRFDVTEFNRGLPGENTTVTLPNGRVSTRRNLFPEAIPEIYHRIAQEYPGRPAWLDGAMNSWQSIALACALDDNGTASIKMNSPDGYVSVAVLPIVEEVNEKWWEEPEIMGELDGRQVVKITSTVNGSANPITPEQAQQLALPDIPDDSIVVLSGAIPMWLRGSIALGYKEKAHTIAAFVPQDHGSTVAWSKDPEMLGSRVEKSLEGAELHRRAEELRAAMPQEYSELSGGARLNEALQAQIPEIMRDQYVVYSSETAGDEPAHKKVKQQFDATSRYLYSEGYMREDVSENTKEELLAYALDNYWGNDLETIISREEPDI